MLYQHKVCDFEVQGEKAITHFQHKSEKVLIESDFVLACDGAHSFMRKKLQIPFEGYSNLQTF